MLPDDAAGAVSVQLYLPLAALESGLATESMAPVETIVPETMPTPTEAPLPEAPASATPSPPVESAPPLLGDGLAPPTPETDVTDPLLLPSDTMGGGGEHVACYKATGGNLQGAAGLFVADCANLRQQTTICRFTSSAFLVRLT